MLFTLTLHEGSFIFCHHGDLRFFLFFIISPCLSFPGQFPGEHGLVAPGMSCHYSIKFAPDSLKDFDDEIKVQTQSRTALVIPLRGRREPPVLTCKLFGHHSVTYLDMHVHHIAEGMSGGLGNSQLWTSDSVNYNKCPLLWYQSNQASELWAIVPWRPSHRLATITPRRPLHHLAAITQRQPSHRLAVTMRRPLHHM